jgi:hypothetical protein
MAREFPAVAFERYCDDVVVHCRTEAAAIKVLDAIRARLFEVRRAVAAHGQDPDRVLQGRAAACIS